MSNPSISGNRRPLTASNVLEALASDLSLIKSQDKMRWVDVGEVLGVGDDAAAKYADGSQAMSVVAYARGKAAWNGRFSGSLENLIDQNRPTTNPYAAQSAILKAALALSVALEDGELTVDEVRANRATLEAARDAIDGQLARLTVRAA